MKLVRHVATFLIAAFVILFCIARFWPEAPYEPYQPDAAWLAQAENYPVPDMPADWRYDYFIAEDGTRLRWGETSNRETAKATVVFVPGYTSTLEMYGAHIPMLVERGYHVVGYDIRGQGGSDRHRPEHPEKLYVSDFSVYGNDLAAFMAMLQTAPNGPRVIMASSFGGAVATRAVGDHDIAADALLLLAPAFSMNTGEYSPAQIKRLGAIARLLGKDKDYATGQQSWVPDRDDLSAPSPSCTPYPERAYLRDVIFARQPELRVGGLTNNWVIEMIENGEIVTDTAYAQAVDMPITLIIPESDVLVNSGASIELCQTGFADCQLVQITETEHCLTLDNDDVLNALWDETDKLLERVTP